MGGIVSNFVFVVEGEKSADALTALGLVATCSPGGAGKWRPEFAEMLRGLDVVVLPDNDETGQLHAWKVARSLYGVARSVSILTLPGLPPKGDVYDYLSAGGSAYELVRLAETTPLREARRALERGYQSETTSVALDGIDLALERFKR